MAYKTSIIISVYNNTEFLKAVLDSLKWQTEKNFEIIISEDACHEHMKNFISSYSFENEYQHLTQPDDGWRKNKALNRAIEASKSDWLIFIDGDCILHPRFVEMHLRYASPQRILAGKRVKLNEKISQDILQNKLSVNRLQWTIINKLILGKAGNRFLEEGVFLAPESLLGFIPKLRKLTYLKGCNMSFSKMAIKAINGFDEDYTRPAIGEDIDLSWRFKAAGFTHFSLRNLAVEYHLHHKENWINQEENEALMFRKQEQNEYICKNGILKK